MILTNKSCNQNYHLRCVNNSRSEDGRKITYLPLCNQIFTASKTTCNLNFQLKRQFRALSSRRLKIPQEETISTKSSPFCPRYPYILSTLYSTGQMRLRIRFRPFLQWLKLRLTRSSSQERREKRGWSLERNEETRRRPGRVGPLWIFEGRDALPVEFRGGRQHGGAPTAKGMLACFLGWWYTRWREVASRNAWHRPWTAASRRKLKQREKRIPFSFGLSRKL